MAKAMGKGRRDELGTGGKPVQANQDSGQTRPHGERAFFRISEAEHTMTPAGPSASNRSPRTFSEGGVFASSCRSTFTAPSARQPESALRIQLRRNAMPASALGRFRCHRRHSKKTRPQTRVRLGALSVDAGRGQREVQSDVRRDGDERRRDRLRRGARWRRGRGWMRHSRPSS